MTNFINSRGWTVRTVCELSSNVVAPMAGVFGATRFPHNTASSRTLREDYLWRVSRLCTLNITEICPPWSSRHTTKFLVSLYTVYWALILSSYPLRDFSKTEVSVCCASWQLLLWTLVIHYGCGILTLWTKSAHTLLRIFWYPRF